MTFTPNPTTLDGRDRSSERVALRIDTDTRRRLEEVASGYGISLSDAIRQAIRSALSEEAGGTRKVRLRRAKPAP